MTRAILFDSDGVLVDSEQLFFEATRAAFQRAGGSLSREQWARWYLGQGKSSREIAGLVGISASRVDEMIARRDRWFWNRIDQGVAIRPGVIEALNILAEDFRLAVVTGASREHYERVHALSGLRDFFEVTVTSDECEHVKPHPEGYQRALQRLSLKPCECLAVEDSPRGAIAALAAGIPCVVIPTHLTDLPLCPSECALLDNVSRLAQFLERETSAS
ncbi:MAG TPA: HAD-IA family hydrolase [Verrucomicrobiae bacterium]|nr:HAD-IA family hydrolase [Verrucomicrobiae bacterium]